MALAYCVQSEREVLEEVILEAVGACPSVVSFPAVYIAVGFLDNENSLQIIKYFLTTADVS